MPFPDWNEWTEGQILRYGLIEIRELLIDQFTITIHVETCCLLTKRKPDTYVHLTADMEDYYRIKDEGNTDGSDENE